MAPLKNVQVGKIPWTPLYATEMQAQKPPVPLVKKITAELIGTFLLTFAILASVQNMILLGTNDFWLVCVTHGLALATGCRHVPSRQSACRVGADSAFILSQW